MIEGHKKHKFGVTQLVFCTAWLCVHYANATFMGTYQSQGVKAFPEVKDVQLQPGHTSKEGLFRK